MTLFSLLTKKLRRRLIAPALIALLFVPSIAAGQDSAPGVGMVDPYFVSLGAKEANLRVGPDLRYPIEWVYRQPGLPVLVIAEFQAWRKIRDWQGAEGWVSRRLLSGKRSFIVTSADARLLVEPREDAAALALLAPNLVGAIRSCPEKGLYCRVEAQGMKGWLKRADFWGAHPQEFFE